VEIIWSESKVFTYNGEAQAPTVTVKGKDDQNELFGFKVTAGNVNVGNYTATVTDLNNDNYTLVGNANVSTSYEIVAQEVVVTVEGSNSLTYNGTPQAPTVTVKGSLDGMDVAFEALQGAKSVGSYSENVVLTDSNYTIREEDKAVAYQIVAKELTIKWTLPDGEKADGKAKTVKVVAEGMVSGENYELVVTITNEKGQVVTNVTEAGTYTVTVTAANNASQNYSIASATKTATFTIEEA
jgi:hypothetical protein